MGILSISLISISNISTIKAFEFFFDVNYTGYIKDTNNQPIYGAKVEFYVNGVRKAYDYTDSNGYYYNILNEKVRNIKIFYKEGDGWNLVYDKSPELEVANKKDCEYVRINDE